MSWQNNKYKHTVQHNDLHLQFNKDCTVPHIHLS